LRFLSAHGTDAFAQEKLNRGLLWVATVVIPSTAISMFFSEQIATHIFNKPAFGLVLFWMLPALPAMAIFFLLSFAFQAQHRVVITTIFQNLGISTVFVAAFGYLWFNQPEAINAVSAAQIYAVAAVATLIAAITFWFSQKNIRFTLNGYQDPELANASMNLWTASIMRLIVQWSGILIAGVMLPAEDVALLSAAQRTAMLTSFALMVVNMVVAPRYARLWKEGNIDSIRYLAKWSTRGMILMVLPVVAAMMIWPENVMSLFGEGFEEAAILLMILAAGQCVNASTGSVGFLLNMSGHERDFNRVTLFSAPLTLVMVIVFTSEYGAIGCAVATSLGVSVQNFAALFMVRKRLNFFPLF
jgi:O-antigen/teichoic acid export membrane protein